MRRTIWMGVFLLQGLFGQQAFPPSASVASPSTNGAAYWDGTKLTTTPTGGAGIKCSVSVDGGPLTLTSCAGSASTIWSSLSDPVANLSLSMGLNLTSFTWSGNTGANNLLTLRDTTGNTGTGYMLDFASAGTSTVKPMRVCAKGTSNCITVDANALMSASGTGGISATHINGTALSGLATGLLKNTTTTGVPSIAAGGTDYEFPLTFSSPLLRSTNAISIQVATGSQSGYLASADWTTFNSKQAALTNPVTAPSSMTTTALVTAAGAATVQTPSATATLDSSGNFSTPGSLSTGVGGSVAGGIDLGQGTASAAAAASVGFQAPTSVTSAFRFTLPGAPAAGLIRTTNATPSVISVSELSGDATTSTSNAVTVVAVHGTTVPTNSAADQTIITTSSSVGAWTSLANCVAAGGVLQYATASHVYSCHTLVGSDMPAAVVQTGQANTAASAMTLDMSGSTAAAALRAPNKAGAAPTAAGAVEYDTTNKNLHWGANGVDNVAGLFLASALPADTDCVRASVSANVVRLVSAGGPCTTGGGGGTVNSGTSGNLAYYPSTGTAVGDASIVAANVVTDSGTATSNAVIVGGGTKTVAASTLSYASNVLNSTTSTQALTYAGGIDSSANSALGGATFRGANETGAGGASSQGGGALLAGGSNAATNTASVGGSVEILAGPSTGSTTGLQGLMILGQSYAQSGTVTVGNLVCFTATAKTVTDCGASPTNIAGVALSKTSTTQVTVATTPSEVPVNASAAVTIGHTVCAGTTAGQVTDSGGSTACATGITVGVVIATTGTWPAFPDGTAFPTLSTTLPLIRLANRHGVGGGDIVSSVALAGSPTTTTQSADDNSTKLATTAYVDRMKTRGIAFSLGDPGGSALTVAGANSVDYLTVPFACTVSAYNLVIDAADSTFRIKFWKVATGTAIPTSSNSISTNGLGVPTATAVHSTTTSDFTTLAVTANDIIAMALFTSNTVKYVGGVLQCDQ